MTKILDITKCLALLAVAVFCAVLTLAVIDANTRLKVTVDKLDNEIDEMHRLTLEAGLTAMEARKASIKESAYLDQWNSQVAKLFSDVHQTMITTNQTVASIQEVSRAATGTLQTTQATVQAFQVPIVQLTATLKAGERATAALELTTQHLDALVIDPAIPATLANVQATTGHLDATSKDVEQEVHSLTHPTWAVRLWGWTLDVAHALNPL